METTNEYCVEAVPRPWWARLFSSGAHVPIRFGDDRTYLTTNIHVHVDWLDRLRLLISGRAAIQVRTYTDVEVHDSTSEANFAVLAPWGK